MSRHIHFLVLGLALSLGSAAHAQISFGIGVGSGRGSGFYFGPSGGYYGPGYYGRGYYPGYYGPGYGYGSGFNIRLGNSGYYGNNYYGNRGYYYSRPQVNNYYVLPSNNISATPRVLPDNKVTPTKVELHDGDILIKSPSDAAGDVGYGINDTWVYTIKPGQKQKLEAGREWTIEFNRGIEGAEAARYSLDPGIYEFHYKENVGWELAKVSDSVLPEPAADKPDTAKDTDNVPLPAEPPVEKE